MTDQLLLTTEQAQVLARYMGWPQWSSLEALMHGGDESAFFQELATTLSRGITDMPEVGSQNEAETVYLHYFLGSSDVWVLEKDAAAGVERVFAFSLLNGDARMAELGYLDLSQLILTGFELDFHFSPKPLAEVREIVRKRLSLF
jgi:hypothetical protein